MSDSKYDVPLTLWGRHELLAEIKKLREAEVAYQEYIERAAVTAEEGRAAAVMNTVKVRRVAAKIAAERNALREERDALLNDRKTSAIEHYSEKARVAVERAEQAEAKCKSIRRKTLEEAAGACPRCSGTGKVPACSLCWSDMVHAECNDEARSPCPACRCIRALITPTTADTGEKEQTHG